MPHRLNGNERYIGQMGLRHRFSLRIPAPFTISIVGAGQRRSHSQTEYQIERYPISYDKGDDTISDLKFAIRYEPLELGLLKAVFKAMGAAPLEDWVRHEPSGQFARRAWFLYEWLLVERLDLSGATMGKFLIPHFRSIHSPKAPAATGFGSTCRARHLFARRFE